jgi:hypothetical protein
MLCIHHFDRRPAEIHESFEIWYTVSWRSNQILSALVQWSESLAPDPEAPGSISGATRFSE